MTGRSVLALLMAFVGWSMVVPCVEAQIYTRRNSQGILEATNVPDSGGYLLTYPGKGTLIHSRGFRRRYRGEYDTHILAASRAFGVDADLIKAVIQIESEFDRLAVSSKGAQGLMQLMPFTARRFGVVDPFDARQNIFGGVQYLRVLLDLFQGDVDLALAGYNAGENAVLRHNGIPPYKETQRYVRKIRKLYTSRGPLFIAARGRATVSESASPVIAFAPSGSARVRARRVAPLAPARPRTYYKYVDTAGTVHVSTHRPADGVSYTLLRGAD